MGNYADTMNGALDTSMLREHIASHAFFKGLAPQHLEILTEAAMLKEFKAGEVIFRTGDPANRFYLIEEGEVAVQSEVRDGVPITVQSIGRGDVLGWSWLFPPYYWQFDARAATDTKAIFFYATWLRDSCERDHDFGYEMLKRMSNIVIQRLQSARQRLVQAERERAK